MKRIYVIICGVLLAMNGWAANDSTKTHLRGFGESRYSLTMGAEYAYNRSWGHYANIDLQGLMPVHRYVELGADIQLSFANVYTVGVLVRPKYDLSVGQVFVDAQFLYKGVVRAHVTDLAGALSAGYRMDYVQVQFGAHKRWLMASGMAQKGTISEPWNFLYGLQVFGRPQTCNWNIWARFANFDAFQMERYNEPLYSLGGCYDINRHWRVQTEVMCKPTGQLNMNAVFYGVNVRVGAVYLFQ